MAFEQLPPPPPKKKKFNVSVYHNQWILRDFPKLHCQKHLLSNLFKSWSVTFLQIVYAKSIFNTQFNKTLGWVFKKHFRILGDTAPFKTCLREIHYAYMAHYRPI